MKRILVLLSVFLFSFCAKNKQSTPEPSLGHITASQTPTNKIMIFKVSYLNYIFKGAKEIILSNSVQTFDSLPFRITRQGLDFGNITLFHKSTNDSIFDGSIIWMGSGKIKFPAKFDTSAAFVKLNYYMMIPDSTRFQFVYYVYSPTSIDFDKLWSALNNLEIVKQYLVFNKKIAIYLYTPSLGIGNPYEWNRIVFMSN